MAQNDSLIKGWQPVIGLEVHVQLMTNTKLFSPAKNQFGEDANTLVDLIDLGLPGVLPVLNEGAMKQGIKFGLATNAKIAETMIFDPFSWHDNLLMFDIQILFLLRNPPCLYQANSLQLLPI